MNILQNHSYNEVGDSMKKILQVIGLVSLICVSFIVTEKAVRVVKEGDQIMIEIKKREEVTKIEPTDAVVSGMTVIPGLSGSIIDVEKSYEKMKRYGNFLESLLEYKKITPSVSLSKNYDKYVISGNPKKNMVTLIFLVENDADVEPFIERLEKTNTKATFFLDGNWFEKNNAKVLELIEKGYEVGNLSYNRDYQDSSFVWMDTIIKKIGKQKQSYCYSEKENKDDLLICAMNKNHTIMPSIVIGNYPLKEIKEKLTAGSLIALPMSAKTLEELSSILHYIESKGYTITSLGEHIEE